MKIITGALLVLSFFVVVSAQVAPPAFPSQITHVVVIFQENRTPDNLFHFLPQKCQQNTNTCIPTLGAACYDISDCGLSNNNPTGTDMPVTLTGVPLAGSADPGHLHKNFEQMCDPDPVTFQCHNDGAWQILPSNGSYAFVQNPTVTFNNSYGMGSTTALGPYLTFAQSYGWANQMFQTNQGPSYPAHQFIFSGTSARTAEDDADAIFVADNFGPKGSHSGCLATLNSFDPLISPNPSGVCPNGCTCYDNNTVKVCPLTNNPLGTFCFSHDSMATLLDNASPPIKWKYYAPSAGSIWTAPNSFLSICQPNSTFTECTGPEWSADVDLNDTDILRDIKGCSLSPVSWVIPDDRWSDHAGGSQDGTGPSWVAAIINEIGGFQNNCGYWQNTAVVVTWDDWGGWSDNQPPPILAGLPCGSTAASCQGDYQYGFRVPMLVVSAYTKEGTINNSTHDFGSILRMIEGIFGLGEGKLGFADARANTDLHSFFNLPTARSYTVVPAVQDPNYFLNFTGTPIAPDNDDPE